MERFKWVAAENNMAHLYRTNRQRQTLSQQGGQRCLETGICGCVKTSFGAEVGAVNERVNGGYLQYLSCCPRSRKLRL